MVGLVLSEDNQSGWSCVKVKITRVVGLVLK